MPRAKTPRSIASSKRMTGNSVATAPAGNGNHKPESLQDEIRRRAYELYEQRGCIPGREHEDWLIAEQEIVARYHQPVA
jgi:hypothetical protein